MRTIHLNQTESTSFSKILLFIVMMSFSAFNIIAGQLINGTITATDGSLLPGVNVMIKGTNTGVISDVNGVFEIQVQDSSSVLVFSFIGYNSQEVKATNINTPLRIVLKEDVKTLDEVVVIGYGVQKKSSLTGSISHIFTGRDYKVSQAFQGKCSGISIANNSGQRSNPTFYDPNDESYSKIHENGFKMSKNDPLSTFSIDVDKASYSNIKRFISLGQLPPTDAVRIEEMINYFDYNYPQPTDEHPFSITTEYSDCPWQEGHKLIQIGLQGKKIATEDLPPSNLVFLIDVSGSMDMPNKLPLIKSAFKLLVNNLRRQDHVAIVVYAGAAGLVLPSTNGDKKEKIMNAINSLYASGSTAGGEGINLAYKVAKENFIKGGNNRVILATDGDFNVGISTENELEDFIVEKRKTNVYLTCLGFGMGNYKDSKIELLADKGNGNYSYINDIMEAEKVFVNEFGGTLFTIAKDVKIQIEFNPSKVAAYRLVGYENRLLNNEDFKDDIKDAGELGSGHTVTALYEIIPVGVESKYVKSSIPLKYQKNSINKNDDSNEIATVKFRYKKPDEDKSIEIVHPIIDKNIPFDSASDNLRFSSSVAMFGMLLRNSEFKGNCNYTDLVEIADNAKGKDKEGYRGEFVRLAKTAGSLMASVDK